MKKLSLVLILLLAGCASGNHYYPERWQKDDCRYFPNHPNCRYYIPQPDPNVYRVPGRETRELIYGFAVPF